MDIKLQQKSRKRHTVHRHTLLQPTIKIKHYLTIIKLLTNSNMRTTYR